MAQNDIVAPSASQGIRLDVDISFVLVSHIGTDASIFQEFCFLH